MFFINISLYALGFCIYRLIILNPILFVLFVLSLPAETKIKYVLNFQ